MPTSIKQVTLFRSDYGKDKGLLAGTVKFDLNNAEYSVQIDATKSAAFLALLADEVVEQAKNLASAMTQDVLESLQQPTALLEGDQI